MLHKVDVGTLITALRPKVKQSIIHTVHHFAQEIKKLEGKLSKWKGKPSDAEKMKKKVEAHRLESALIKAISIDDVIKFALTLDFSQREKMLGDVRQPIETRLMVRIATTRFIVAPLEEFRSNHPEWEEKLPDLLKTLGIFSKHKKKVQKQVEKSKRKDARKQKLGESSKAPSCVSPNTQDDEGKKGVSSVKVQKKAVEKETALNSSSNDPSEESEEDVENEEADSDDALSENPDGNEAFSGDQESDDADGDDADSDDPEDGDPEDGDSDEDDSGDGSGDDDSDGGDPDSSGSENEKSDFFENKTSTSKKEKLVNIKQPDKKKQTPISSGSVFAEVRRFSELLKDDNPKRQVNTNSTELLRPDTTRNDPVVEDTFFMTGENKFLKTVAVKRGDGEGLSTLNKKNGDSSSSTQKLWSAEGRSLPGCNRRERRAQLMGRASSKPKPKRMKVFANKVERNKEQDFSDRKFNKREFPDHMNMTNVSKLNTKREFPDDKIKNHGSKFIKKDSANKIFSKNVQENPEESLHPSWQAKKKQKVSLDSFRGKKIVFDDN